jgi:integrase
MPLSDAAVRSAKPKEKPQKLADGGGLYLLVMPTGRKWWRLKYRFDGKEKSLSLGVYPDTGLKEAREKREAARKLLAAGVDPGENRKAVRAARALEASNSFEIVAREWFAKQEPVWAASHSSKVIGRLEADVFPWIGNRPMDSLTAPDLLAVLRKVEARGAADTAHRILQNFGQVFRYAVATGRATHNPAPNLRGALRALKKSHFASITDPKDVGALLRAIDGYEGAYATKAALRLAPLVFVRPGELRAAEWSEVDLDKAEWNIPAERMKLRIPHLVPLSRQALEILRDLHKVTGKDRYLFPSARSKDRPMSNNAILAALRRMGYEQGEMTGHGFRAMARTILDEVLQVRPDYIEHQLAHAVRDPNGRAYNRTAHKAERQKMMQLWADYLDGLKAGQG